MKTIALANQKGGVGKTTTAASLGIGLSRQGKKVLLVDADAQGNLTQMLGWAQPDELSPTLADMMGKIITDQPITPGEGILVHREGVHLLPANIELSAMEVTLVNTMSRETVLKQYLSSISDQYDFALIDCMPSLGMLTINALTAADSVIIPVQADYYKVAGAEPRSVVVLKQPFGNIPAGAKVLWVCGERAFQTVGGIFGGKLRGGGRIQLIPIEEVLDGPTDWRIDNINLDGPCQSENEYMKRYSAANYAHRIRVGLER